MALECRESPSEEENRRTAKHKSGVPRYNLILINNSQFFLITLMFTCRMTNLQELLQQNIRRCTGAGLISLLTFTGALKLRLLLHNFYLLYFNFCCSRLAEHTTEGVLAWKWFFFIIRFCLRKLERWEKNKKTFLLISSFHHLWVLKRSRLAPLLRSLPHTASRNSERSGKKRE